jgi:chemotaxis protein MotB
MAGFSRRRGSRTDYTWPGYVDALSSLLMVVIFVLAVFVVAQFYLSQALGSRDQALEQLNKKMAELASILQLEQTTNTDLRNTIARLTTQLGLASAERDKLKGQLAGAQADKDKLSGQLSGLQGQVAALQADNDKMTAQLKALQDERDRLSAQIAALGSEKGKLLSELTEEQKLSAEAKRTIEQLSANIAAMKAELARLNAALEASDAKAKDQQAQIVDLSQKLNRALVNKVEELARYRSEFFGRLREVLGSRKDIVVVGDRFVFQSEVLFDSGSAELGPQGLVRLADVADALNDIASKIPKDIDWILQVDGHTDTKPIRTAQFPSNWELSSARAIAVLQFLHSRGIPYDRLAARGFGEFQPLTQDTDPASLAKNRRIELKITTR